MLFGDTPDDAETLLGLTARAVRTYDRGVMFTFRSPSLLLLLLVSATRTCGNRGRVVVVGALARTVGVRPAVVGGVALAATRGVSGAPVRLAANVGRVGLPGGGRPWAVRSDDIPGLRGYRGEYIGERSGRAEQSRLLGGVGGRIGSVSRSDSEGYCCSWGCEEDPGRV